jgi:hypothetical protein
MPPSIAPDMTDVPSSTSTSRTDPSCCTKVIFGMPLGSLLIVFDERDGSFRTTRRAAPRFFGKTGRYSHAV